MKNLVRFWEPLAFDDFDGDNAFDPHVVKLIDVDHTLTGLVGEIFELSGWITDGDMDGPFRIEHTIEHSVFEGTTVM